MPTLGEGMLRHRKQTCAPFISAATAQALDNPSEDAVRFQWPSSMAAMSSANIDIRQRALGRGGWRGGVELVMSFGETVLAKWDEPPIPPVHVIDYSVDTSRVIDGPWQTKKFAPEKCQPL